MKVVAIHGSPRTIRSTTRKLATFVLEGAAENGAETEIIDLADLTVIPCTACEACTINGICVHGDDVPSIIQRMIEADGIVFGSPVYIDNVTGQMKIFFDRLADAIHYQVLAGKYGCSVATTYESGGDENITYQNHVLNYLGVVAVGGISLATGGDESAVESVGEAAKTLGKNLVDAIKTGFSDSRQESVIRENRAFFKAIVEENRDFRPDEYERWLRMGWIDK